MKSVSIITPLFNKAPYVAETIQSVLAQTMADWEMIVVENGSTDQGPNVVRQFTDPRIHLVESPKRGPGAARNLGLEHARGEWILFLDADDLIERDYLNNAVNCGIKTNAEIIISRWQKFVDSPDTRWEEERSACEESTHVQLMDSAIVYTPWALHAAVISRRILKRETWWPEQMDEYLGEDTVFWFRLLLSTSNWVCHPVVEALYRWKSPQCRTQNDDVEKWFQGLHRGACENVRSLAEKGLQPTAKQAENLMRLYEGLYQLARRTGNKEIENETLKLTRQWLIYCLSSSRGRPGLVGRHLLGIRFFNLIRQCVPFRN